MWVAEREVYLVAQMAELLAVEKVVKMVDEMELMKLDSSTADYWVDEKEELMVASLVLH